MSQEEAYSLVVAAFDEKDKADFVYNTLLDMQNADMLDLKMASTLYRSDKGKLQVHHKHGLTTWKGAAGGVAIGFLLGGPLLGGAVGALIGSRGKGELHQARELLDQKLGQDDSAIVILLRDAEWEAVRDMLRRFSAEPLLLELTPEAEQAIAEATADEEVARSVREDIDIHDHTGE